MRKLLTIFLFAISATARAQTNIDNGFPSGDYDMVKVSCDVASKTFTIIDDSQQGTFSCSLFLIGRLQKNHDGKYPVKAYPYGFGTKPVDGTVAYRNGKNGHKGTLIIQVSESGSCQNMTDYRSGVYLPLDKIVPYHQFSLVKTKKALIYADGSLSARKKGYFIQGDFVSILKETKDFCQIASVKKLSFRGWINKSDLVL